MLLKMYISGELIDTVVVLPSHDNKVNVDSFRRQLLHKHSERLATEEQPPSFALEGVPSRVNYKFTSLADAFELPDKNNPLFPPSKKHKE